MPAQRSIEFMADRTEFPAMRPVRALVVDDFESMQQALTVCLESVDGMKVVGTASNGQDALEQIPLLKPDLVVVDLQMPVMDGFQLIRRLRKDYPHIVLVAVCGHASPAIEQEAISAGAHAFVSKSTLPQGLLNKVQSVLPN